MYLTWLDAAGIDGRSKGCSRQGLLDCDEAVEDMAFIFLDAASMYISVKDYSSNGMYSAKPAVGYCVEMKNCVEAIIQYELFKIFNIPFIYLKL